MKNLNKKTRAYALKNALVYKGKANQGSVISSLFHEGLKKADMKKYGKKISEIIKEVNSLSLEEQKKEFEKIENITSKRKIREGLPELPNVKKSGIITRIAPSPSGPLHVGHALTASLSILYVKKYGGKFYVRIEDTNPENICPEAYKMIKEEANWLSEGISKIQIQSDHMKTYYKYVKKLLSLNAVYVCICSAEKFKKFAESKKECPCRNNSKKENLIQWKKMLDKNGFKEGEAVLRFKSSGGMKHKNPAMRDFPLARINLTKHPRQGNKYRVWPLMNLAVTVDDIETGMTHIIRAKDHRDNAQRQRMIYKVLGVEKKHPWMAFLGKWKFTDLEISCSKTKARIEKGEFTGWDDPRLPFLASLKKKYSPRAFWKFAENRGFSEVDRTLDKKEFFQLLNTINKNI